MNMADVFQDTARDTAEALANTIRRAADSALESSSTAIKTRLRCEAKGLRQQADRLESLAKSLPEVMHPEAAQALHDLIAGQD